MLGLGLSIPGIAVRGGLLPAALFDFANTRAIPAGTTFTRASSGTYLDASGVMQNAGTDVARFPYAYESGQYVSNGYLSEAQATNLQTYSGAASNGGWSIGNGTKTAGVTMSPIGFTDAATYTADGSVNSHFLVTPALSFTGGTTYTLSVFVKKPVSGNYVQLLGSSSAFGTGLYANFLLTGAGSVTATGAGVTASSITQVSSDTYRLSVSGPATATATAVGAILALISSASSARLESFATTDSFTCCGMQVEVGTLATSYIATTSAQVTRAADSLTGALSSVIPAFNANQGSIVVSYDSPLAKTTGSNYRMLTLHDGTSANRITLGSTTVPAIYAASIVGGVTVANINVNQSVAKGKCAYGWAANSFRFYNNGTAGTPVASGTPSASLTSIGIGMGVSGEQFNGTIASIAYYNRALTDAQLQALST